jgi:hypothetical protein
VTNERQLAVPAQKSCNRGALARVRRMKHLALSIVVAIVTVAPLAASRADAPGPPPSQSTKMWSKLIVQSIKPTLSARNVYVIRGMHANGVRGGWALDSSYAIDAGTKAVQIKLAASAPQGAQTTRDVPTFETKLEIKELAGPAYSGAPGKYDVIVVDRDGKELARTVYEVKAPS